MKSKAELLKITGKELPKFLKEAKERDPKFLMPKLKAMDFPEVTDLTFKMLGADYPDVDKISVKITVKFKKAVNKIYKRTYHGACVSYIDENNEYEQRCVFENVSGGMFLFLKYFTEYHIYNTLSQNEIAPNEWNDWDKILKKYIK